MSVWRILTNAQAEADYERMELQILQVQTALTYLDQAAASNDNLWLGRAIEFAGNVHTQSYQRAQWLSPTPLQQERLDANCERLRARLGRCEASVAAPS